MRQWPAEQVPRGRRLRHGRCRNGIMEASAVPTEEYRQRQTVVARTLASLSWAFQHTRRFIFASGIQFCANIHTCLAAAARIFFTADIHVVLSASTPKGGAQADRGRCLPEIHIYRQRRDASMQIGQTQRRSALSAGVPSSLSVMRSVLHRLRTALTATRIPRKLAGCLT